MSLILVFLLFALSVAGDKTGCVNACQEAFDALTFKGTDPNADYYTSHCDNVLRAQSTYVCAQFYCSPEELTAGLASLNSSCQQYGSTSIPPFSIIPNITAIAQLRKIDIEDAQLPEVISTIVFPTRELFEIALRTLDTWDFESSTHAHYSYAMFGFWGIVLLIGIGNHIFEIVSPSRREASDDPERQSKVARDIDMWTNLRLQTKRYITIPAAVHYHCSQPVGWCTVPARIQSLTILAFILLNLVLCCLNYRVFSGNLYWSEPQVQLWRYIADRTGIIAIANLPLLFTFAMRNNVLLWLTGWNFATFNKFHRWVARVATVEAVVHAIAYTVEAFLDGGKEDYYADWSERYWWCGAIAVIVMSFLGLASVYPIRRHLYDLFLALHIAFALVFLVTIWYHVEIFDGEYDVFIWPCVAVWAFDRVLRIARVVLLNCKTGFRSKALATYTNETGVIRLSLPTSALVQPRPGVHYYLYVLNGLKFWESHPFTLSTWEGCDSADAHQLSPTSLDLGYPKQQQVIETHAPSSASNRSSSTSTSEGNRTDQVKLSFIIRPYDGFTSRLRQSILSHGGTSTMNVLVEGPYGTSHNLKPYRSILLIVGGTGVTSALSYLCDLTRKEDGKSSQSIELVWAVSTRAFFDEVFNDELSTFMKRLQGRLRIALYITGHKQALETENEARDKEIHVSENVVDAGKCAISTHVGRPAIGELVMERACDANRGKMAILSCGPPQMADDVRLAVVHALAEGCHWIDYFPESFDW